jgi:hypothetical protein
MAWLFVTNIVNGVGAIVWMKQDGPGLDGSMSNAVSVYCDVGELFPEELVALRLSNLMHVGISATKIIVGSWTAVPAAILCIAHRLMVASARVRFSNPFDENNHTKRDNFVDAVICFVVPAVFMALRESPQQERERGMTTDLIDFVRLDYIVQDHRFDLVEVVGCQPAVLHSIPSVFIVWVPVLLLSFVSLVLAGMPQTSPISRNDNGFELTYVFRRQHSPSARSYRPVPAARYLLLQISDTSHTRTLFQLQSTRGTSSAPRSFPSLHHLHRHTRLASSSVS